ncbi:hypothetical protein M426DRAFT_11408 [Hypoxylon sp. CI-4A]|nr:hypothetical protein M426DRAFT_11408 [Hypoxylon sp. CI-4A]
MRFILENADGKGSLFEILVFKAFVAFGTSKILRGSSKIFPQVTVGITVLIFGAYLWSSHVASRTPGTDLSRVINWRTGELEAGNIGNGLRIVVFGGGDVATPSQVSWQLGGLNASWTDILCLQLNCYQHLSFIPPIATDGGAIVSNSLFESALSRASSMENDTLDYSWIAKYHPIPSTQDLLHQIENFLATPQPQVTPRETLWVFNIGFWDIWNLAALPRKLAALLIETQAQQILAHIELLYEEAHKNDSAAFSNYYADMDLSDVHAVDRNSLPRAPFRVLLSRPFDISLTPGFESARSTPPPPHSKAEHLRNAAFLTQHWDKTIQEMLNDWVRLPDLEDDVYEDEAELLDIKDSELLLSKKSIKIDGTLVPPARREAITYDISSYIQELIIERQLREADIVDHNGVGSMALAEGYSEVREPCIKRSVVACGNENVSEESAKEGCGWSVCDTPDEHLFLTDFTVNKQVVFEVGRRAAEVLRRHARMDAEWVRKAMSPLSSLRRGS